MVYALGIWFEAKTIATHNYTRVQDTILTYHTVVIHLHARVEDGVVTNLDVVADIGMRVDLYTFSELDILADIGKSSDVCILGDSHAFANEGWLLHALFSRVHGFRHQGKELSHGSARVLHADESGVGLAIEGNGLGHEYNTCARLWQVWEVLGIAEEGELSLVSRFDRTDVRHLAIGIARDFAAKQHGYLLCRKFHID